MKKIRWIGSSGATRAALAAGLAVVMLGGCGGSESRESGDRPSSRERDREERAADKAPEPASGNLAGGLAAANIAAAVSGPEAEAEQDEAPRGRSRQARCQIDGEAERPCTFTPVMGDGSFDIQLPDRQLRLIIDGDEAAPFALVGERPVPIAGLLRRDPDDRACWVAADADSALKRVCAR